MKPNCLILLFSIFSSVSSVSAQKLWVPDTLLNRQIYETGLIHSPLPVDASRSYEAIGRQKKIVSSRPLSIPKDLHGWKHSGKGEMAYSIERTLSGDGSLKLHYATSTGERAVGSPDDPDYATYGNAGVIFEVGEENWEGFNRIAFHIYPDCDGARVVNMNLFFHNDSDTIKAGYNQPSGAHLINLVNKQWNTCFLDIDEYQRDRVKQIGMYTSIRGNDRTTGETATYYIDQIELQQTEDPEIVSGWMPKEGRIVYSTSGYASGSPKTAILNGDGEPAGRLYQLVDAKSGQVVFERKIRRENTSLGSLDVIDFTEFDQHGEYHIQAGTGKTPSFRIGDRIWDPSLWRVLNFIFCQRCGYAVPGIHSTCHLDLYSEHDGKMISYAGGWHDAGDLSQQTLQTGDVTYSLLELYNKLKKSNMPLAMRLLEEAEWGLEFILKNRYGDGCRASSMGLLIWQDGILRTTDDITSVRVQNLAFDNFLYAAYEAYAAMTLDRDPMLQEYLVKVAREDFGFAMDRHEQVGYGEFYHLYEHSYHTSESQYMATISWSASMLYKLTGDPEYARIAAEYIRYTLDCQRKEPLSKENDMRGFFYRDTTRRSIVHSIHQSREQIFMQAMTLLCETQPGHPDYPQWRESVRIYGEYLKQLMPYTAPYGMIPSGVYHVEEYKDSTGFYRLHLFSPKNAEELYSEQVKKGVQLDEAHYLKRFPVWFSIFNGNTAIHLSTGKSAAICGNFLKDKELLDMGLEQLYWTVGKNPFGQSLIYGEGYNYPQLNNFSSGEITGAIPVGIRTLGNEDIPYWPHTNNACYKEVWVTSAGKWLSLIAEY
ncbi:MAG: glycoside hydrolase family 9 protein [Bacteroides sp.]|nr:glycoside hydrolase family 9 protein [Bacteroides sp.]